jgi:hypothetical protein
MSRLVTRRPWLIALAFAATLAGCGDKALLGAGLKPLAVGAYQSVGFSDVCNEEDQAFGFCTPHAVTQVLDFHSEDPTIADVVLAKDHPRANLVTHAYYVVGKAAGQTSLVLKGVLSDGSTRDFSTSIRVEVPDAFRVSATTCYDNSAAPDILTSAGSMEGFSLQLLSGSEPLEGWLPDAVTADGLTEQFMDQDRNDYIWQAPATPAVVQMQSSIVSKIDGQLKVYGPEQVTEIDISGLNASGSTSYTQPGDLDLTISMLVGGQAPCHGLPIEIHSATPSICSGPSGETVWPAGALNGVAAVHAEGNCVLAGAAVPGGPPLNAQTLPIFFVQPPPSDLPQRPELGVACPVEGATACGLAYFDILVCRGGQWIAKAGCAADQTCDFVSASTPGCVAGASCAQCRGLR